MVEILYLLLDSLFQVLDILQACAENEIHDWVLAFESELACRKKHALSR